MRRILAILILSFPVLGLCETVATCSPKMGHAYYANMGIVDTANSDWKILPANGTVSLSRQSDGNFDMLFTDATKQIRSSTEEGAKVKLLRNSGNEMVFLVSSPDNTAIEIYDFLHDKRGKDIITIITNEGGSDMPFYKSSVEYGECSFINFNILA